MSDFKFQIEGDAGKADQSIGSVLDKLDRVEADAREAGRAITAAFNASAAASEKAANEAKKAAEAGTTFSQRINKIADALAREQQMLERIHGPARRYAEDLRALNSLLEKGEITTQQYADQVTRLNRAIDGAPKASPRLQATAAAPTSGGGLGGLRSTAAAVGVTVGVSQIAGMASDFENLQNRLRFLAGGDMQKVNELFGEMQGLAARTRSDLGTTTEGFIKITMATKSLGLTQTETLAFTERLNKAIVLSGATTSGAQAAMLQLSQGLSAGALRGEEFNSVLENAPEVINTIAASLGVTTGQLRLMAFDGKLTSDVVINAFKKAGDTIDANFNNTLPTAAQGLTAFKNEMTVLVGETFKSINAGQLFSDVLKGVVEVVKFLVVPIEALGKTLDKIGVSSTTAAAGFAGFIAAGPVGAIVGVASALAIEAGALDDVTLQFERLTEIENKFNELQKAINEDLDAMSGRELVKAFGALNEYSIRLSFGAAAADAFKKSLEGVNETAKVNTAVMDEAMRQFKAMPDLAEALDRELNEAAKTMIQLENAAAREKKVLKEVETVVASGADAWNELSEAKARAIEETGRKAFEAIMAKEAKEQEKAAREKARAEKEMMDKVAEARRDAAREEEELAKKAEESAQRVQEAWATGLGSITAELINMARAGELSFDRLLDVALQAALQIAALSFGGTGGAFLGGLGGGLSSVPGFASGGQGIVGGAGGVDQNLFIARVSRGERVTVETEADQRSGKYFGGGGGGNVRVVNQFDPTELMSVMDSPEGERVVLNIIRRNRGALRSYTGGR